MTSLATQPRRSHPHTGVGPSSRAPMGAGAADTAGEETTWWTRDDVTAAVHEVLPAGPSLDDAALIGARPVLGRHCAVPDLGGDLERPRSGPMRPPGIVPSQLPAPQPWAPPRRQPIESEPESEPESESESELVDDVSAEPEPEPEPPLAFPPSLPPVPKHEQAPVPLQVRAAPPAPSSPYASVIGVDVLPGGRTREPAAPDVPARHTPLWRDIEWMVSVVAAAWLAMLTGLTFWSIAPLSAGMQPRVVLTGSMYPSIRPGDVVMVAKVADPASLPVGRVAVVRDPTRSTGNYVHRVVKNEGDGTFVTKGDANQSEDFPAVTPDRVMGQVLLVIPRVGLPMVWLREHRYMPIGITVLGTWLSMYLVLARRPWVAEDAADADDDADDDADGDDERAGDDRDDADGIGEAERPLESAEGPHGTGDVTGGGHDTTGASQASDDVVRLPADVPVSCLLAVPAGSTDFAQLAGPIGLTARRGAHRRPRRNG